jgi:hypothetical protein
MVLIYGEALSNGGAARRLYMERYPGRQVPCERTFVNAVQHLVLSTEIEAVQDLGVSWSNCILSMASSKNRRRTQFFKHRLNHR